MNTHSGQNTDKKFSKKRTSEEVIAKTAYNFKKSENKTKKKNHFSKTTKNIALQRGGSLDGYYHMIHGSRDTLYKQVSIFGINILIRCLIILIIYSKLV